MDKQIKTFRSLFSGREEAYGLETSKGPIAVREPLTDQVIRNHLTGTTRIGVYLLSLDSTITWSAFDFDSITPEKLQLVIAKSIESQFYPYPESSKSRGYHVHFFFDEPIQARPVRALMNWILKEAGISGEIFPKQDVSSNNGLGNFLWLPEHGGSVREARTLFLNSELTPYPNQWDHLSKVHRTKTENILELVKELRLDEPQKPDRENVKLPGDSLDVAAYLKHYHIPFSIKKEDTRIIYQLNECPFSDQHSTGDGKGHAAIIQGNDGKITFHCKHVHCENRKWEDARKVISGDDPLSQFWKGDQFNQDAKQAPVDRGLPKDLFQIIDEPEKEEIPLIENLLYPGDKGFIVSMYKMGKTLFLIQMALCLSMAVRFLGLAIPRARKVLFLRFELKDARFRKRLAVMLPALGGREMVQITPFFHMTRGFDIKSEKDFQWLLSMIYKFEPEVLFLDPFYKLSMSSNLKDPESAQPIIRRFDNLMGRFPDLHVSIAHHLRKQTGGVKDDSWDSAYGPMQLFADMDYEIRISRKARLKDTFVFSHISNDVPIDNFSFARNPSSLLYEIETTEDIRKQWALKADQVVSQVQNGINTKGNLKTWIELNLEYSQRDTKDFLEYLLNEKKLVWTGNKTRGKFVASDDHDSDQSLKSGDQNNENDLFQSLQSSD